MTPTIGLFGINMHAGADPAGAARIGALAERLGYDSLWAAEHVVLPRPRVEASPMDPEEPILDPLIALAHLAAHTERVQLGTGIVILPQRNPVVLAKQLASLDVLSGGRLIFGLGVGYLEPEMSAIGVPMAERGARADEYLAAMRSLWEDREPAFDGRHVSFSGVDAHPRPAQQPLPIVIGGHSAAAHRRAAEQGDGWYGFALGREATTAQVASLRAAEAKADRRGTPLELSLSPRRALDAELVREYGEIGIDRLVVVPPRGLSLAELERFVEDNAPARVGGRALESS